MKNQDKIANPNELKKQGHIAGLFYLSVIVFGIFAEITRQIVMVDKDPIATASNIMKSETMYRMAFLSDLIMIVSFLMLGLSLHRIFAPVDHTSSKLFTIFVAMSVPILTLNMINHFMPIVLLDQQSELSMFTKEEIYALVYLFLKLHGIGYMVAQVFFGLWLFPLGVAVVRSEYLPKFVGILLMVASLTQLLDLITAILLPGNYSLITNILAIPSVIGEFLFAFWILLKGARKPEDTL